MAPRHEAVGEGRLEVDVTEVIEFKRKRKPEPALPYTCECGSVFWRLWDDGVVVCAACDDWVSLTIMEDEDPANDETP